MGDRVVYQKETEFGQLIGTPETTGGFLKPFADDGNGGNDQATVTVNVVELPDEVEFRLETVDSSGEPISTIPAVSTDTVTPRT